MSAVGWGGLVGWNALESRIATLEGSVAALEAGEITVESAATFSALPDPSTLPDGRLGIALDSFANGQAAIWVVRSGAWVLPLEAFQPTISAVARIGGGAGELPENVVVGTGTDGVLGVGWVLDEDRSFFRPAGVAEPLDLDDLTLGPKGPGLWRVAVELNYTSPAPGTSTLSQFLLQRDSGSGFADVGEVFRLQQGPADNVTGIASVGLALNESLLAGDAFRVIVRHDNAGSITYTVNKYSLTFNQIASTPT